MTKPILTKAGVDLSKLFPVDEAYQSEFKKLWGLTK
jgi:hypothetical protein